MQVRAPNYKFPPLYPEHVEIPIPASPANTVRNWVGRLQEHAQDKKLKIPVYKESREAGENGFICTVTFENKQCSGNGPSKKEAKRQAARIGLISHQIFKKKNYNKFSITG